LATPQSGRVIVRPLSPLASCLASNRQGSRQGRSRVFHIG